MCGGYIGYSVEGGDIGYSVQSGIYVYMWVYTEGPARRYHGKPKVPYGAVSVLWDHSEN